MSLTRNFETAARQNLEAVLQTQGTTLQAFTDLEIKSMVMTEELRLTNGLDLAAVMMRGQIIKEMRDLSLFTVHPEGFGTMEVLAEKQGISRGELSDTEAMYNIIFPWFENVLGVPVAQVWEQVGKTNLRTMVPYLKACITGEAPATAKGQENYNRLLDTAAIEIRELGEEPTEEAVRERAARRLLETAEVETSRGLQEHIRDGNPTPALEPTIVVLDGRRYLISEVDEEQMLVVGRKMGRYMAPPTVLDLPTDRRARQREALRSPVMRAIREAFEG